MKMLPGLNPQRLVSLMRAAVERCTLNLSGAVVLTEAATGAYSVTPVLAAMAGAQKVFAITRSTRYGSAEEVTVFTRHLSALAGVAQSIEVITEMSLSVVHNADIITNSGHVRPINSAMVAAMRPGSVVPLMYEAWEYREADVDLKACRSRGIRVTATNERHPNVDVFSYLGVMAVKLLLDAGVAVYRSRVLVLCDNDFAPFIVRGLDAAGAAIALRSSLHEVSDEAFDAVLVALTPRPTVVLGPPDLEVIAGLCPGSVLAVYWGDVDRSHSARAGLSSWPEEAPPPGHMGILPSDVGPEPIVRLQSGSLKAAEALWRHAAEPSHPDHAYGEPL
jgi:hypothetical protein